jgi:hypothetical protein
MSAAGGGRVAAWSSAAALLACAALAAPARAQDIDLERFVPALDAEGFLGVQGSRTPGHLRTSFGAFVNYTSGLLEWPSGIAIDGVTIDEDVGDVALVDHRVALALSAELGLGERVALALTAPLVLYQTDDVPVAAIDDLQAFAVSDPGLHARCRLLGDAGEDRRDGPGLGVQAGASAPIGSEDAFASDEAVRAYGQLLFDMHLLGLGFGTSVGVRHVFSGEDAEGPDRKPEMTFGAALKVPIPPLYPLAGLLEVRGATDFQSSDTTPIEGELGALLGLGEWTLALAVGAGLHGRFGSPDVRAIAGVWYTPSVTDTDGDGVSDGDDGCPPLPEDRDGHQDGDGCPDPDNDNDLVPDVDDLCPNQEAIEGRDDNEDGCTD